MMQSHVLKIWTILFVLALGTCSGFLVRPSPTAVWSTKKKELSSFLLRANDNVPEYDVLKEEGGGDSHEANFSPQAKIIANEEIDDKDLDQPSSDVSSKAKVQFSALQPGTVVQIQVGDVSLARKAWKKRRRSGSPLLIPCSILNVDRASVLRWNLIYLLEKFGAEQGNRGIQISLHQLSQRHRMHLKSSLTHHAEILGYESSAELLQALFHKQVQDAYGVSLVEEGDDWFLKAPISRFRAQKRAKTAAILQFHEQTGESHDTLLHTGFVRNRREDTDKKESNMYELQPLSAALRVSHDENTELHNGSLHPAVVFDYDPKGDAGNPLISLSLDPTRNQVRDRLKIGSSRRQVIHDPRHQFEELSVGTMLEGKIVRLVKGGALVDCRVGRKQGSEIVQVLGKLSFKDAVEEQTSLAYEDDNEEDEDEEEWDEVLSFDDLDVDEDDLDEEEDDDYVEVDSLDQAMETIDLSEFVLDEDDDFTETEDLTHLFELESDGSLVYHDPETGESKVVLAVDEEDEDDEEDFETSDEESGEDATDDSNEQPFVVARKPLKSKRLHVGDNIQVFVKSISKQSRQITYSMNPSVQGKKAKDLKQENHVTKKLSRLAKQLGGLHRVQQLRGQECDGIVQATSRTGTWYYVKPTSVDDIPVGVAHVSDADQEALAGLNKGDAVRIQIEGVDEDRGQLSLRVLRKLSP